MSRHDFFPLLTPFYGYYMNNINVDISQPIWNMKFWNELPKDWNERVIFSHFDPIYSLCNQIITFNALYLTLFMKILNELPNRLNFGQLMSLKIWISKKITRGLSKDCMLKCGAFILKIMLRRDFPVFCYSGAFPAFLWVKGDFVWDLKVIKKDFRNFELFFLRNRTNF